MNQNHEIYKALAEDIPAEDVARLDGYLAAKAEETEHKRVAELEAKVEALSAPFKRGPGSNKDLAG